MTARQFYSNQSLGAQTHTGDTALTDALSLTFTPDASSSYYLFASCERAINSTSNTVEVDVVNSTSATTFAQQSSAEKASGNFIAAGVVAKETFGASPAAQTYKIQYKTSNSASTAQVRDCNLIAVKKGATDLDATAAGPFTGTNTSFADVTSGPSLAVGAGTWLLIAVGEVSNSGATNLTRIQLTDGTNTYGVCSLPSISGSTSIYKAWFTAVKVTLGGTTTYNLQTSASAGTWGARRLTIIAIDLTALENNGYQADLTRSSVVNPSGVWTTKSTIGYTPPSGSLNHLLVQGMMLDGSAAGVNVQGRSTVGGTSKWANTDSVNSAFSTLPGQIAFGFQIFALAAGATTITNDFTGAGASATVGCASSVISVLQLDAGAQVVSAVTATATGTAPAPAGTGAARVAGAVSTASADTSAPTVSGAARVTAVVATGTATALAPSVTGGAFVTAETAAATGTALAPSVGVAVTVQAETPTATADVLAPTVTGAAAVGSVLATASGQAFAPAVTGAATVDAPAATATGDAPAPAVMGGSGSTTVTAETATGSAEAPTPTVTAGATVDAPLLACTADLLAPSVTAAVTITAPTATGTTTAPAPTVTAGATIPATCATATCTALAPSVGGGATVHPGVAACTASALVSSVTGLALVTAELGTATCTLLEPVVAVIVPTPTPAERIFTVTAERRSWLIATEIRVLTVSPENRVDLVPPEPEPDRALVVPAETRLQEVAR